MKNKIKTNVTVNKEENNMENVNTNATENAAPAADQNEAQNVPTPPANEQAPASEEKPKKKGIVKKILMIIGAVIALITGGFIAGRVTGKSDDYTPDESGDDNQTTDF